jgi:DNA-binding NarL/FixJ family response regulator
MKAQVAVRSNGVDPDDGSDRGHHTVGVRPRILIVDDHAGFRAVARRMLEADGFSVVGEAVDGESALRAAVSLRPSVVLLDIHLPDMDGFAVSERLAALVSPPTVVLISSRPMADLRQRVTASPVAGFLAKHELSGIAIHAIVG